MDSVSRIRCTQKGDQILEQNKSSEKIIDSFRGQVEKMLREQEEVKAREQDIVIECKDLQEVVAREEQFNLSGIEVSAIKRRKKTYGGTETAIISLPVQSGITLITAGKVRIGVPI